MATPSHPPPPHAGEPRAGLPRAEEGGAWLLDLDGVVWLSGEPIAGAGEAVRLLRGGGARVLFATNNSSPTVTELIGRLRAAGIEAAPEDVVSSGMAAASMLAPGTSALVVGDDGVLEALAERGVRAVRASQERAARGAFDAVVVGYTRTFDYEVLARAAAAVRAGARLVGTNDDATLPTPDGPLPGAGSILAAVAKASGADPAVAGKPHEALVTLVSARAQEKVAAVVGDRPSTDGALARALGVPFALVLTGVTARADGLDPAPAFVGADLLAVARAVTG